MGEWGFVGHKIVLERLIFKPLASSCSHHLPLPKNKKLTQYKKFSLQTRKMQLFSGFVIWWSNITIKWSHLPKNANSQDSWDECDSRPPALYAPVWYYSPLELYSRVKCRFNFQYVLYRHGCGSYNLFLRQFSLNPYLSCTIKGYKWDSSRVRTWRY